MQYITAKPICEICNPDYAKKTKSIDGKMF